MRRRVKHRKPLTRSRNGIIGTMRSQVPRGRYKNKAYLVWSEMELPVSGGCAEEPVAALFSRVIAGSVPCLFFL